jgi:ATP-binding protein involved in chromosome partitioning
VVTTPGEVSLIDARKAVKMFEEVRVPVLGILENMSYFTTPDGQEHRIFGTGGGAKLAAENRVPFLGELPIDPRVAACADAGEPMVRKHTEAPISGAYLKLASQVLTMLATIPPASADLPAVEL